MKQEKDKEGCVEDLPELMEGLKDTLNEIIDLLKEDKESENNVRSSRL